MPSSLYKAKVIAASSVWQLSARKLEPHEAKSAGSTPAADLVWALAVICKSAYLPSLVRDIDNERVHEFISWKASTRYAMSVTPMLLDEPCFNANGVTSLRQRNNTGSEYTPGACKSNRP